MNKIGRLEKPVISLKFVENVRIMGVATLDKQITQYLGYLNTEQKRAVLSVVKTFAHEEDSLWMDKAFVAEMDKRFSELENGKVKGITLDEMETTARKAYKSKQKK